MMNQFYNFVNLLIKKIMITKTFWIPLVLDKFTFYQPQYYLYIFEMW